MTYPASAATTQRASTGQFVSNHDLTGVRAAELAAGVSQSQATAAAKERILSALAEAGEDAVNALIESIPELVEVAREHKLERLGVR